MKQLDTVKLVRMSRALKRQCEQAAMQARLNVSEWIRGAMRQRLQHGERPRHDHEGRRG